jgi:hypothetical protein
MGEMKQGFLVDKRGGFSREVSEWAEGAPEQSFFGASAPSEKRIPVGTFRCAKCGFLESYALPEFAAQ